MDLKKLARSKGTNIKRLAEECGVPPSTLYAIASGNTNPGNVGIDLFLKISKALGMSAEELYREHFLEAADDEGSRDGDDAIDRMREQEIIDTYRMLSDRGKQQVLIFVRGCAATFSTK